MKFGKRLASEAARRWKPFYLDYKRLKRALQEDIDCKDAAGTRFGAALRLELQKVATFYVDKEEELQAVMQSLPSRPAGSLAHFLREVGDLRRYAALNYVAVIKAVKKRNRHLQAACGDAAAPVHAVQVLSSQYFFTSPRLAALATHAEVLASRQRATLAATSAAGSAPSAAAAAAAAAAALASQGPQSPREELRQLQCPVCLSSLHLPVVLTCGHRYCWGCLLAHCATSAGRRFPPLGTSSKEEEQLEEEEGIEPAKRHQQQGSLRRPDVRAPSDGVHVVAPGGGMIGGEQEGPATYCCPECRKPHLLDINRLQVDPHLHAYIEELRLKAGFTTTTESISLDQDSNMELQLLQQPTTTPATSPAAATDAPTAGAAVAAPCEAALSDEEQQQMAHDTSMSEPILAPGGSDEVGSAKRAGQAPLAEERVQASASLAAPVRELLPPPATAAPPEEVVPSSGRLQRIFSEPPADPPATDTVGSHHCGAGAAIGSPPRARHTPLLPPRPYSMAGELSAKLTVALDLDGTLVSSYSPRRAPRGLGPGVVGYLVGKGQRLNPQGVFVVERPGLREFFRRVSAVAEIVLFTAGLEDYAAPIADALEARYGPGLFAARLYRPATVSCEVYPCVKDLSLLGRDLRRTLLVDDTPLAFYHQPCNGVPVYNYRCDPDDRILVEAVAPLVESLAEGGDVRQVFLRKFDMPRWMRLQGLPVPHTLYGARGEEGHEDGEVLCGEPRGDAADAPPAPAAALGSAPAQPGSPCEDELAPSRPPPPSARTLLLLDFDKTLTDCDAGERLVGELAPELVPQLQSLEMPANFVPLTNSVLAEMQRRGVSRNRLVEALRGMGAELPSASTAMLRWASSMGLDVRLLSDCNTVFIHHMLSGAGVGPYVREVLTNHAVFERVELLAGGAAASPGFAPPGVVAAAAAGAAASSTGSLDTLCSGNGSGSESGSECDSEVTAAADAALVLPPPPATAAAALAHRLVIQPRHDSHGDGQGGGGKPHGCPLCPENLCKGSELRRLRRTWRQYERVVYCGDGANDLCPALELTDKDVVLVRRGHGLDRLIQKRTREASPESRRIVARIKLWDTHEQLFELVQQHAVL